MGIKITFFSNYLNEHQLPLSLAWDSMEDIDFTFVALEEQGSSAGRRNMNNDFGFVLREYESENEIIALEHAEKDDIVIFGHMGGKEQYVEARMKKNKLTFRAAERILKRGYLWRFFPPKAMRTYSWFTKYKKKEMYVLCASAFTAGDLTLCGWPLEKCYQWGYFPVTGTMGKPKRCHNNSVTSLLWAARLVELKRPFEPLRLAKNLKEEGYQFNLTIAGDGPMREEMISFIDENDLSDVVHMSGMLSGEETKRRMALSDIYITTSSCKEGWGATVNEAMGAGCAVIASASIGSSPLLIDDGKNGFLYDDFSEDDLLNKVRILLENCNLIDEFGAAAKETICREWNAEVAAHRFVSLAKSLRDGGGHVFESGPCSPAGMLRNRWYHSGDSRNVG